MALERTGGERIRGAGVWDAERMGIGGGIVDGGIVKRVSK
jgi:hypothetical protein